MSISSTLTWKRLSLKVSKNSSLWDCTPANPFSTAKETTMRRTFGVIGALTICCTSALADELVVPKEQNARQDFIAKAMEARSDYVKTLVAAVEKRGKADGWRAVQNGLGWECINALGDMRSTEAVQPLMDIIDLQFVRALPMRTGPDDHIVIEALAKIGKPASRAAVEKLANDDSKERAPRYVRVIALVEGVDLGKEMVRLAIEQEKDAKKKARLKEALGLFKNANKPIW